MKTAIQYDSRAVVLTQKTGKVRLSWNEAEAVAHAILWHWRNDRSTEEVVKLLAGLTKKTVRKGKS